MSGKRGPLALGDRFLKHTIRGLLGTGGHAWVYHGHDEFLDVEVAIKILHRPGGVTTDMLRRGQAEAKLLYRLKHENIVSVLDAGITDGGLLYIVMELLEGETLRRVLLKNGRLAVGEALELFAKIADGVEAAHSFGAIHRDLKPENIFVLAGSHPKVLDFGIAKVVDAAGWTTEKDVIHGTVLYMAPEQLRGEKATAASDVYALGLMLFEVLNGRHPLLLKNHSPTIKELTWMQLSMKPPPLETLDTEIPRHLARLVERMILKVPAHRPSSMKECAEAMRACLTRLADGPSSRDESEDAAPQLITDKLHDTDRIEGTPFDASITLPRLPIPSAARNTPDPVAPARLEPPLGLATVRPVSAAVTHTAPRPLARGFDDDQRRRMLQVLVASCVVGAALGGVYVVFQNRSAALQSAAAHAELAVPTEPATTADAPPALPLPVAAPLETATVIASTQTPSGTAQAAVDAGTPLGVVAARKPKRQVPKPVERSRLTDLDVPILE
jgi:serine/threonine protein kinase